MDNSDRKIALRAYHIWEQEGRPHGLAEEHWERARFLVGIEQNPQAGTEPNPSIPTVQNPSGTARMGEPVEPLREAVTNLGEFPGQSDQGDKAQAPIERDTADASEPTAAEPAGRSRSRRAAGAKS